MGYFFIHGTPEPLEEMRPVVEALGYTYVGILEPSDDEEDAPVDDEPAFYLHVERIETHSCASLFRRCEELSALARKHAVDDFDGFDVGTSDGSILAR